MEDRFRWIGFVLSCMMLLVGVLGINYIDTINHENVHVQVQKYFGCQESHVKTSLFGTSSAWCSNYSLRSEGVVAQEFQLHAINEVVNYNVDTLLWGMVVCTLMICGVLWWK